MRRIFVDSAESKLRVLATLLISISGSRASSMICVATPGGDGKLTSERRCASTSGFTRNAPSDEPDPTFVWQVSVLGAQNLNAVVKRSRVTLLGQAAAGAPPGTHGFEQQVTAVRAEDHDPGGYRARDETLVEAIINARKARAVITPQCHGSGEEDEDGHNAESHRQSERRKGRFLGPPAAQTKSLENIL